MSDQPMRIGKRLRAAVIGAFLGIAVNGAASATGIPVIDISNLLQAVQQYLTLTQQLAQMEQQYHALTGSRGMGALYNSALDQQMRQYAPPSWQRSLDVLKQGGLPASSDDVSKAAQTFLKNQGLDLTGAQVYPGQRGNNPDALAYAHSSGTTAAAAGLSQAAYDQSGVRMKRVQQYLSAIDGTTDLKAAVDLNARLLAETNEALTQLIQLEAAQMQMAGTTNAANLRGSAQEASFVPYERHGARP